MTRAAALIRTVFLCVLLSATALFAQNEPIDFGEWDEVAQRAEQAVESASASTEALEVLRSDLASYRDLWLNIQANGDPRLQTLQSQLDALGPVPEQGEEPAEISQRREQLTQQIDSLQAPLLRAEEAFTRADGLVAEIDNIIRSRQTDALLQRGPEPLDPRLWAVAYQELTGTVSEVAEEVRANWQNEVRRTEFINDLPATLVTMAIALLLLFRTPAWTTRLGLWLRSKTRRGTGVWTTLVSLLRVALPVGAFFIAVQAVDVSGVLGPLGSQISFLLPPILLVVLFTRWLAAERFTLDETRHNVALAPERRKEARYYANALAWLLALSMLVGGVEEFAGWSETTLAVLSLPIHVLCGLVLFRLGQIMRKAGPLEGDDQTTPDSLNFVTRVTRLVAQGAMVIGVVGPVLSAIGYLNVAEAMIFPAILTLGLFGILLTLQTFVRDVYHLITGKDLETTESLVPVISGIILIIGALPLLALIWGARLSDLTELWSTFRAGFSIGETRISPTDFLTFALVFAIGFAATRLLQGGLRGSVLPKTRLDKGGQTAIVSGTGYLGIFLSAIVAITAAGIDLSALAIVFGALSVGIGFGLQNIVQNFVSGIILLIERPIAEGDWIEVNGQQGFVRDISVRSTRIETFDRTDVIVPNADFVSNTVTNYTRGNVVGRLVLPVGVAYGSDTRKVEEILYKIARDQDMVMMNPPPFVHFAGFGADSLDFDIRMILRDITSIIAVRTEMNHLIYEAFKKEGIEIPFAQRDVWLRNPEALRPQDPASTPSDDSEPQENAEDTAPPKDAARAYRDASDAPEEDST
ncbi:DUF3772 domain-containing protein [Marivita hallyeonensis]|uniref:Small-conductance mechanosensitive channel n=1 Tax=Marivita hallyeonensis TaxID=996342 RepID=A0A1M5RZ04_9RHOB|nr:DUF3772 domain-containing protein [Marivita hallyeonensis]SHH31572.1 Small-conductance mechanosensitive channel [Marivita hallyeonensis]